VRSAAKEIAPFPRAPKHFDIQPPGPFHARFIRNFHPIGVFTARGNAHYFAVVPQLIFFF